MFDVITPQDVFFCVAVSVMVAYFQSNTLKFCGVGKYIHELRCYTRFCAAFHVFLGFGINVGWF